MPSLQDYAESQPKREWSFVGLLPQDVRDQLLANRGKVPVSQMVAWLKSEGYEDATSGKLDNWFQRKGK